MASFAPPNEAAGERERSRSRSRSPPEWLAGRIDDPEARQDALEDRRAAARVSRRALLRDLACARVTLAGLEARMTELERLLLRVASTLIAP